jgi:hypothetical protein
MSNSNSDPSFVLSASSVNAATEKLLAELKVRARIRLNSLGDADPAIVKHAQWISKRRRWPLPPEWKLHHAFNIVAAELGFRDWEHARVVLSGLAKRGDDLGGFWHDFGCEALFNHWFARYDEAKQLQTQGDYWLFPYGKQFIVVDAHYVRAIKLDPESDLWPPVQRDLASSYGSDGWRALCAARLTVTRGLLPLTPGKF